MKSLKLKKPIILDDLEIIDEDEFYRKIYEDESIENTIIENLFIVDIENVRIRFNSCIFKNVDFDNCDFRKIDISNVIFKNCNLSNLDFSDSGIYRTEFINCKLTGAIFNECTLRSILFKDCIARYSNFAFSKLKDVVIEDSDFQNAVFQEIQNEKIVLNNNNLIRSVFSGVKLNGVDFTTNQIDGMDVFIGDVEGAIFSEYQALDICKLMKIVIK